tara:strand:- start:200 stop:436 length:237 start_codon:yes stop_codon:yes gene_type:complete
VAPAYPLDIARQWAGGGRIGGDLLASSWHFVCFQRLMVHFIGRSIDALSFDATPYRENGVFSNAYPVDRVAVHILPMP